MTLLFQQKFGKTAIISALLSCMLGLSLPSTSFAVKFANVVPGLTTVDEPVKSIRELKLTGIVQQTYDFSCGAAALATLLKYGFDENVSEKSVLLDLMAHANKATVKKYGLSLLDLKSYALRHGYQAQGYTLSVDKLSSLRIPALILMNIRGYKHFVILKKVEDEKVYLSDPMLGNRVISLNDFKPTWNNVLLVIMNQSLDKNSILLNPQQPVSAKALLKISNPDGLIAPPSIPSGGSFF